MELSREEKKEGQELTILAIYELCHYVDWSAARDVLFNQIVDLKSTNARTNTQLVGGADNV